MAFEFESEIELHFEFQFKHEFEFEHAINSELRFELGFEVQFVLASDSKMRIERKSNFLRPKSLSEGSPDPAAARAARHPIWGPRTTTNSVHF